MVLPEGFFSNSSAEIFRKYVAKHCKIRAIISLPRGVFSKGTTTKRVQAGKTGSHQKMSILYAEKIAEVEDGSGIEMDFDELNYSVFLASVQKPSGASEDEHWIGKILERVLENYRHWEVDGSLDENGEAIRFDVKKRVAEEQQKLELEEDDTEIEKTEAKKKMRPSKRAETVIPEDLEDIF